MTYLPQIQAFEKIIYRDKHLLLTLASYVISIAIYVNLSFYMSPYVGILAFALYVLINSVFLGHAFFERESMFLRMIFGTLLLIMLLGFLGWIIMIIYDLDRLRFTIVLLIATTVSSSVNRWIMRNKNDSD